MMMDDGFAHNHFAINFIFADQISAAARIVESKKPFRS
jgi:hypothetical protein